MPPGAPLATRKLRNCLVPISLAGSREPVEPLNGPLVVVTSLLAVAAGVSSDPVPFSVIG